MKRRRTQKRALRRFPETRRWTFFGTSEFARPARWCGRRRCFPRSQQTRRQGRSLTGRHHGSEIALAGFVFHLGRDRRRAAFGGRCLLVHKRLFARARFPRSREVATDYLPAHRRAGQRQFLHQLSFVHRQHGSELCVVPHRGGFCRDGHRAARAAGVGCVSCHAEHRGAEFEPGEAALATCTECHNDANRKFYNGRRVGTPHGGTFGYPVVNGKWTWKGLSDNEWSLKQIAIARLPRTRKRSGAANSFTRCTCSACARMVYRERRTASCRVRVATRLSTPSIARRPGPPAPNVTTDGWS